MNEQLQQELAAWLGRLREAADAGASFALEQAPLIVQEKVAYGRVMEPMLLLVFTAGAVFCAWAFYRGWTYEKTDFMDEAGGWACIASAVFGVLLFICAVVQMQDAAQAWFAPRLYVLEWLAGLLK